MFTFASPRAGRGFAISSQAIVEAMMRAPEPCFKWVPPPQINPSFANHTNADGFNAGQAGRPVLYDT